MGKGDRFAIINHAQRSLDAANDAWKASKAATAVAWEARCAAQRNLDSVTATLAKLMVLAGEEV